MAYTLAVNHPEFDKGFVFDCDGILVKNGDSVKLSKDDEEAFRARWGVSVKDIYGHSEVVKLTGTTELSKSSSGGEA